MAEDDKPAETAQERRVRERAERKAEQEAARAERQDDAPRGVDQSAGEPEPTVEVEREEARPESTETQSRQSGKRFVQSAESAASANPPEDPFARYDRSREGHPAAPAEAPSPGATPPPATPPAPTGTPQ